MRTTLTALTFVMLSVSLAQAQHESCASAVDKTRAQYIVGYGSLMETDSRLKTAPNASDARPIRLKGYERTFAARSGPEGGSTTLLALQPKSDSSVVAVLYQMEVADFIAQDEREKAYCRTLVAPDTIQMLDGSSVRADSQIWFYDVMPDRKAPPSADYPIIQSYVDIMLNGCMQLAAQVTVEGVDFVHECIAETTNWSTHWVNDRIHPRRAFAYVPNARAIDALIMKLLPKEFAAIRIE